jgi:hypothetical protein
MDSEIPTAQIANTKYDVGDIGDSLGIGAIWNSTRGVVIVRGSSVHVKLPGQHAPGITL